MARGAVGGDPVEIGEGSAPPRGSPAAVRRPRLFATAADEPRARRASDVVLLVLAVLGLVASSVAAEPPPAFITALQRLAAAVPDFLDAAWQVIADVHVLLAVLVVVAAVLRRRGSIVRDLLLAAAVSIVVWLLAGRAVEGSWPQVWDALRSAEPPPWYPSLRIALPSAVVITASPHLTRPARRIGRWVIASAAVAVVVLGATTTLGAIAGVLVAAIAAASVHLVFGSSGGRPGLDLVGAALADLGVAVERVGVADRQQAGVFTVDAAEVGGRQLVVKVYGRDAYDAAVVSTIWRTVWFREAGSPLRFGRLQQVEHEAFLTLFARQAGIPTDAVVTAGAAANDDALLVLAREGRILAETGARLDRAWAGELWALVAAAHEAGLAHGQLDDQHLLVIGADGTSGHSGADPPVGLGLTGFRGAALAPTTTQLRTDECQALVTTMLGIGVDDAVAAAVEALGHERLAAVLPFVQPSTLTARQRRRIGEAGFDLDDLRGRAAAAVGTEPPALQQLRRITWGSVVRVVLPAIALIALLSLVAGLDVNDLLESLRGASWWLVALGVVVAQLPRLSQAVSTLGASPVPLPLGPVYALQLTVSYVNLAIPTAAARVAVNIRFFQRHGVAPGAALAAGALDGFGGFVVQALLLLVLLILTSASLDVDLAGAAGSAGQVLVTAIAVGAVVVAVVAAVAPLRRAVVSWVRRLGGEAFEAVRGLRSPRRIALLIGGNLATEVLFASALATFVAALGHPIGLGEALLINISVALLSGVIPIPGGVGVVEGALTYGLVMAGVPEEAAFAAVLLYRASSFYLPPIWGFFAMRWLERNQHL